MKRSSRAKRARGVLLFWCLFIGAGAVAGAAGMLLAPDGSLMGMGELIPYFQVLPLAELLFQDFVFPGIALLCVNGIPNLIAAALLLRRKKAGVCLGGALGVTLMAWIAIQFVIFPWNVMSTSYFVFGVLQALTGYAAWVFGEQEAFTADPGDYPGIGTDPRRLVVYFSRMGYTKKAALEEAGRTGAQVYELRAAERTEGTLGFWWCGRYGMHRWDMPIEAVEADLTAYDHVTICTPIWVFHLAAPVRTFCRAAAGQIREADYILVHHQRAGYWNAADEMDALLGLTGGRTASLCCRHGRMQADRAAPGGQTAGQRG